MRAMAVRAASAQPAASKHCYHLQKVHLHLLFDCKSLKLTLLSKSVEQQESCTFATPPPVCSSLMHYRSSPGEIHLHYKAWIRLSITDVSTTRLIAGDRVLHLQSPAPTISSDCSGQRPYEVFPRCATGSKSTGLFGRSFPLLVVGPLLKSPDKTTEWERLVSAWGRHREMVTVSSLLPEELKAELSPHLKETLHICWQRIRQHRLLEESMIK